jgi:glycosyltransferase involved in cell wall biosynthesis
VKRKIVFVNQATGYLTIDIINSFAAHFNTISLITGSIRVQDVQLNEKVIISRITKYNRGGKFKKALSWLIGTLQTYFLLVFKYPDHEIFFTTLPPPAYLLIFLLRKRKFAILFYDLYPESLKIVNIHEGSVIYKIWGMLNKKILNRATCVFTLSEGMMNNLQQYVLKNNIVAIPNWSGLSFNLSDIPDPNPFRLENNLHDHFLVEYSGNIGYSHKVEILVELAGILESEKDLVFLIIGRGERFQYINDLIRSYGLTNCLTLPFIADDQIKYSLSAADLSVVMLDDRAPAMSVPSKVYNLLKVGSPIMGIGSPDSELAKLIAENGNGINFMPAELHQMADFILQLKNDPQQLDSLRTKSLAASKKYTPDNSRKYVQYYLDTDSFKPDEI